MILLTLWVSGGPVWHTLSSSVASHTERSEVHEDENSDQAPDDKEPHQAVLSSLETGVIPAGKIQVAFFCAFTQVMALAEQPLERVAVDVPFPQSNYVRTLLRRIISPNAP